MVGSHEFFKVQKGKQGENEGFHLRKREAKWEKGVTFVRGTNQIPLLLTVLSIC